MPALDTKAPPQRDNARGPDTEGMTSMPTGIYTRSYRPLQERFWEKVSVAGPDECWTWNAGRGRGGYGQFSFGVDGRRRTFKAHRLSYEWENGPIPGGLQIDHLCRNRACVNPAHLEAVTQRENILRGEGITAREARQTHCIHGHEFTPENTYEPPSRPGQRLCRECNRIQTRDRWRRAHGWRPT